MDSASPSHFAPHESLKKRLTLFTAAAGYDKTTLVVHWLDHICANSAWIPLDKSDGDKSAVNLNHLIEPLAGFHRTITAGGWRPMIYITIEPGKDCGMRVGRPG
jgi:hypothetical protein